MYSVVVVGATGLVGREILSILSERKFPVRSLTLFASRDSEGELLQFSGKDHRVFPLDNYQGEKVDFAFFSAGESVSLEWVPVFARAGAVVIDNTSAYRMESEVPLIVPEVNPEAAGLCRKKNIIANPNCSTIQMVLVLKPLDMEAGISRVVVSTYQAVSGAGREAVEELSSQSAAALNFKEISMTVFPHRIAFNCIPHIDSFEEDDYTGEEMKMVRETGKIMGRLIRISATCVRVPVFVSHGESINIEFDRDISPARAKDILGGAPGIKVIDDVKKFKYPLNIDAAGKDEVFVGRIRRDRSVKHGLNMWIVSDNLRRGAALNAVQIAELSIASGLTT